MSGGLCPSYYAKYLISWLNIDRKHEGAEAVPVAVAIDWPRPRTSRLVCSSWVCPLDCAGAGGGGTGLSWGVTAPVLITRSPAAHGAGALFVCAVTLPWSLFLGILFIIEQLLLVYLLGGGGC